MVRYEKLFESFFLGGFECSTHRLATGKRLDEIAATQHDRFVRVDYLRLRSVGIRTVHEGLRWHLIESRQTRSEYAHVVANVRRVPETPTKRNWFVRRSQPLKLYGMSTRARELFKSIR